MTSALSIPLSARARLQSSYDQSFTSPRQHPALTARYQKPDYEHRDRRESTWFSYAASQDSPTFNFLREHEREDLRQSCFYLGTRRFLEARGYKGGGCKVRRDVKIHPLELQGGEALVPPRPAGKKSMAKEEKSWMDLEAADAAKQRSSSQAHDSHISELEATRAEKFSEFIAEIKTSDRISMGLDRRGNLSKDEATVLLGAVQTRFNKVNRRSERLLHNMQHMNMVKEQDNRLRASSIRKNLLVRTFRPELMNVSKLQPSWNRSNDLPPRPFDGSKSLPLKQPKSVKEGSKSPLRRARSVKKELQVSRAERLDEDRDSPPREAHADRSLNLLELPGEIILLNSDVSEVLANKKKEMSDKRKSINLRARRMDDMLHQPALRRGKAWKLKESGNKDKAEDWEECLLVLTEAGMLLIEMSERDASWEYNMRHCIQHERWSFEGFCGGQEIVVRTPSSKSPSRQHTRFLYLAWKDDEDGAWYQELRRFTWRADGLAEYFNRPDLEEQEEMFERVREAPDRPVS